jgi:hypothetical protein
VFNSYHDDVRAEIERQKWAFAEDLGDAGVFEEPFESQRSQWADQFRDKEWPEEVREKIDGDGEPVILVLPADEMGAGFTSFDPTSREWAIIWFSDFEGVPYDVKPLFQTLARKTKAGDDVIVYLREVAERRRRREAAGKVAKIFGRTVSYVDWKPKVPFIGLSIDVKAILEDLLSRDG